MKYDIYIRHLGSLKRVARLSADEVERRLGIRVRHLNPQHFGLLLPTDFADKL